MRGENFMATEKYKLKNTSDIWNDIFNTDNSDGFIFHRVIGMYSDENTYLNNYYDMVNKLESIENKLILKKGFDMKIDETLLNKMNIFWVTVTKIKNITSQQIVDLTFRYKQDPLISEDVDRLIKEKLVDMITKFRKTQDNLSILKNFYVKFVYWIEKYIIELYKELTVKKKILIYFGDIKRDEISFLQYLNWLGVDILYINTLDESGFSSILDKGDFTTVENLVIQKKYVELPVRPKIVKHETIAFRASQELHEMLHTGDSGLFKPWQFENFEVQVVPLQTTYDEMIILWKETSNYRTGFAVDTKTVYVPSIFSKISGVQERIEKYWLDLDDLRSEENTVFFDSVPFVNDVSYHKQNILLKGGRFEADDVKNLKEYKYTHLRLSIQNLIIDRINDLIELEDFFLFDSSKFDFKYKVLHTILQLDKRFIEQLQKFDFASNIPKVVIYDGDERVCTESDAIVLGFLHLIGFDIALFTPTGYQNIENLINNIYFDTHKMPKFEMNLQIPVIQDRKLSDNNIAKDSWFKKFFN
jgi:hypothetical protein